MPSERNAEEVTAHLGPRSTSAALATGKRAAGAVISLDQAAGEDAEVRLVDMLPDDAQASPEDRIGQMMLAVQMQQELQAALNMREQQVLTLRFGLDGSDDKTLEEVSRQMGLTRERVRQIEATALAKLRVALRDRDVQSA